jgi:hypothetical protein
MTQPKDTTAGTDANEPSRPRGRYRYQGGRPLDPAAGVHPEMDPEACTPAVSGSIPDSPEQLIAMQENKPERPEKPARPKSTKVKQVLDLIDNLDTTHGEDLQIALAIVASLERMHDEVVDELEGDDDARHSQIIRWAIDGDRLYRSRLLLESVDLE